MQSARGIEWQLEELGRSSPMPVVYRSPVRAIDTQECADKEWPVLGKAREGGAQYILRGNIGKTKT